jgi:hypothetical protein
VFNQEGMNGSNDIQSELMLAGPQVSIV